MNGAAADEALNCCLCFFSAFLWVPNITGINQAVTGIAQRSKFDCQVNESVTMELFVGDRLVLALLQPAPFQ